MTNALLLVAWILFDLLFVATIKFVAFAVTTEELKR
jgi:hypothetical protein